MKILVVSPFFPHPLSGHGGGEYVYGLIKYLSISNDVTLATFSNKQELRFFEDTRKLPVRILIVPRRKDRLHDLAEDTMLAVTRGLQLFRSCISWEPYYVSKYRSRAMAKLVADETASGGYDVVQIEFTQMAQYAAYVRHGKLVMRAHDVNLRPAFRRKRAAGSIAAKLFHYAEWCQWSRYERRMPHFFDRVLTFTEQDRDLLQRVADSSNVLYNARGIEIPGDPPPYETREPNSLLYVGVFGHRPNADAALWLCSEIFPGILKSHPQTVLYIVGKNPTPEVRALAEKYPGIRLLGYVPAIEDYLTRCRVFVAPIRQGGGIKTKIIHAQSYGMPVVTTPIGAEGIVGSNGATWLVRRGTEGMIDGTIELLEDPGKAADIAARGRVSATEHYAWGSVVKQMEAIYDEIETRPTAT